MKISNRKCCCIFALFFATGWSRLAAQSSAAEWQLPGSDRARIAEAMRLSQQLGDRIWPGLGAIGMPVLLVTDSAEFLVGRDHPGQDFSSTGRDRLVGPVSLRPRSLPPTLLATFPIAGEPTIVIGTAQRTGKSSTFWVLTLLHEHFHQWQYTRPWYYAGVAGLDLARGDTTGMWMLNYPFPYDSAPIAQAARRWALALRAALETRTTASQRLTPVIVARDSLRERLAAADYRYLEFQLWQEGVARFVEYRAAGLASRLREPLLVFRTLPDYQSYQASAAKLRRDLLRELEQFDLGKNRRISFYSIGAAIAMLLEETDPGWKQAYSQRPFSLAALLGSRTEQ